MRSSTSAAATPSGTDHALRGVQALTLSDYPGKTAAVVFTQGCNFRCPFCHNGGLLPAVADDREL
ncbi:MAG TPA: hypothetical protein PLI98_15295, partial [Candidatus Hydrogenedentes bacterium]|nr:hypothetical protein [Candidatus Hydrogenedentota bacterium]